MSSDGAGAVNKGFLRQLFDGPNSKECSGKMPILQVVQFAPMEKDKTRYRIVLSDIDNYVQGMLATQTSPAVHSLISVGCFVRLRQFTANSIKGRRILIVIDIEPLTQYEVVPKIGQPAALVPDQSGERPTSMTGQGFYGAKKEESPGAPRTTMPAIARNATHGNIMPIEAISPYANKWTIKARVSAKSEIKHWHNKNGEGKLFSVNLLDESGEIKMTAFNDQCDMYYDMFQPDAVYYIGQGDVKMARKQFSTLNHDYEISMTNSTLVEKAEDATDVPKVSFNFLTISEIANVEKDAVVDVIGVLKEIGETSEIVSKATSKTFQKRELTIVDNTQFSIRVTIWGAAASSFNAPLESVVGFKGVKVSDFGGRSLSLLASGTMNVDPDIDEAHRLKGWYDATGRHEDNYANHESMRGSLAGNTTAQNEPPKTIQQVKDERIGLNGDEAEYFTSKATIIFVKRENMMYPACPSPPEQKCNKKVQEEADGTWRCETCAKNYDAPEYRYVVSMNVADHTGQLWINSFDETSRSILGMSAGELKGLEDMDLGRGMQDVLADATWQTWTFRVRAKVDTYQDQTRVRYQVMSAVPINYARESKKLDEMIRAYG